MGSNVVIRVEGVSITIVDGNITIEQTKTEAAATPTVEDPAAKRAHVHDLMAADACAPNGAVPTSEENGSTVPGSVDDCGLDAQAIASVINPPPGKYGPPWSAEELEQLRALYPTHSASAIAAELGRPHNSVRSNDTITVGGPSLRWLRSSRRSTRRSFWGLVTGSDRGVASTMR